MKIIDIHRFLISEFESVNLSYGQQSLDSWEESAHLICFALKLPFSYFDKFLYSRLKKSEISEIEKIASIRIKERKPLAYIMRRAFLGGVEFYVDERVIIPRSLIAEILVSLDEIVDRSKVKRIVDICTGSGCLAILASLKYPEAEVEACDISVTALEVAEMNINNYGSDIQLFWGDTFDPLKGQKYDLIISNPPYVDSESMKSLAEEFLHEPSIALDGGEDGCRFISELIENSASYLNDEGFILVEVGNRREFVEKSYPSLRVKWLDSEKCKDGVFLSFREDLEKI